MKNLKLSAILGPILVSAILVFPVATVAASNTDKPQKAEQTTQEQREAIEKRRKKYEALSKAEKKKVRQAREKYKEMTPEERRKLKEKWKKSQDKG